MFRPSRRALAALATAAAVLPAAAACSSSGSGTPGSSSPPGTPSTTAAQFPLTVHAAGGNVTITRKPTAIVSVSPTATETLFAIGAGAQVKAVDQDSDYPAAAPHTKLDSYHLNAEAVATYQPDLVVASGLTSQQTAQFRTLHIPVLDEPAATDLQQAYGEITQLGQATGHADKAAATVAKMRREIEAIAAVPTHSGTYYYELDQTHYSVTSATFVGKLLRLVGLHSIADSAKNAAGGYPQLTSEFILKANPDYVFLADTRCCKQSAATVAERPGWSTLAAVRGGRVVALDDDIASRWGPRIVDLLRTVSTAMRQHPVPVKP